MFKRKKKDGKDGMRRESKEQMERLHKRGNEEDNIIEQFSNKYVSVTDINVIYTFVYCSYFSGSVIAVAM